MRAFMSTRLARSGHAGVEVRRTRAAPAVITLDPGVLTAGGGSVEQLSGRHRVFVETIVIVGVLVGIRELLWQAGVTGMSPSPLASSIVAGGVFVMGLVVAGTLSDYRDAERAPTDLAASLYSILRECESMSKTWQKPDMVALRQRLIAVVTTLRADINSGRSRDCQAAIEDLSTSFLELEESDVPANYVVRLRQEQAGLRKSLLRVYHIQREEFLPSAKTMIFSIVAIILGLLMFTNLEGHAESLVTLGFLSFFFLYLLRLLMVIDKPFKVGRERTEDDVSLFLLNEFVVHANVAGTETVPAEDVTAQAEALEELMVEVEHRTVSAEEAAEMLDAVEAAGVEELAAGDPVTRPDAG
jgi:hypothetical protein